ncbi:MULTISPECIES: hypothetical protein [unclassified Streptomyces]|uniref:hypothetical protein n=1 Tax=unclassified Streptomyces TaxID=2593676 RepID=UPI0033B41A41
MADGVVDSDELLRRIRLARDWVRQQEERVEHGATEGAAEEAAAYRVVRMVLDKLVDPTHH